ncbi:MAG: ribulose-phosphate 3-epimerase [Acidobacteria bacterium]|nr:ribulose-phosphate 3-epimerase [Acidobacteriota bacterium]
MVRIAPSLLAADFWALGQAIQTVESAGVDLLHVDIMDSHFVPNLSMGPGIVKDLRKRTKAELDVHLMVTQPEQLVGPFADAGADWLSFHIEATYHPHRLCDQIRKLGCKAGITLNPGTPISAISAVVDEVDFILIMSVNPGFGGQSFIPATYDRLNQLRSMLAGKLNPPLIEVDGGVGTSNIGKLAAHGMQIAVAGSSVFAAPDPAQAVRDLQSIANEGVHA